MRNIIPAMLLCLACISATSNFAQPVVTVTECNLNGWVKHTLPGTLGTIKFVNGPTSPPQGLGSVQLASPDMSFVRLRNAEYSGTLLSSITEFSYSAYVEHRDSTIEMPFIVLLVDANGDGQSEHNLVFAPHFQTGKYITSGFPDQGVTKENVWQTWDALNGVWFYGPFDDQDHGFPPLSLASYISQYPNATINNDAAKGGAAIRLTSGGPVFLRNFVGYADNFKIGVNGITTTFDFEQSIAKAGSDQKVYYGYGTNCTTLSATAAGGFGPYSFAWSGDGINSIGPTLQVCPTKTTTFKVTVTDAKGCIGVDQVTVFVNDVRCGNKNDKVLVCHNGEMICIAANAVEAHLNHGDDLGSCTPSSITSASKKDKKIITNNPGEFQVANYPNPVRDVTTIQYRLPLDCSVSISISDAQGRTIATPLLRNQKAGIHSFTFSNANINSGTYYFRITAESPTKSFFKIIKIVVIK